jgi:hypothetical protein
VSSIVEFGQLGSINSTYVFNGDTLRVWFQFKTSARAGTLFFAGSNQRFRSFVHASLVNGAISVSFALGSNDLVSGISTQKFNDDAWHSFYLLLAAKTAYVNVDGEGVLTLVSKGATSILKTNVLLVGNDFFGNHYAGYLRSFNIEGYLPLEMLLSLSSLFVSCYFICL